MAQNGFIYEANASKVLKKYGISTGVTAGASHDKPDLELVHPISKKTTGCELKLAPTAAGSLVLKYFNGVWSLGDHGSDEEKIFLHFLADQQSLVKEINKKWGGKKVPYLQNDKSGKKIIPSGITKREAYSLDIAQYGGQNEVIVPINTSNISAYYNKKKCHYLNVGTHGFYLLGKSDPFKLNQELPKLNMPLIPDFALMAGARIRCRCQNKGGGDYQFVMTLDFQSVKKSPYNLAPIKSLTDVSINIKELKNPNNISLITAFRA